MHFHGSYNPDDCTFLLEPLTVTQANQAALRQCGGAIDYNTLIDSEAPMPHKYVSMFLSALERHKEQIAQDVARVAFLLASRPDEELVLTSLVRAGTPIGVLLHRALRMLGRKSVHYSISATRKRGSDPSAIDYIRLHHDEKSIVFVDGWTGKGFIAQELAAAMQSYNQTRGTNIDPTLVVLADLAGVSGIAASAEDYLIPAAMLRSTVCGLISASMLNPNQTGAYHPDNCLYYEMLSQHDYSRTFVDTITPCVLSAICDRHNHAPAPWSDSNRADARATSDLFVQNIMDRYEVADRNHVKPGICEANRALLTRTNQMTLIVRDPVKDYHDLENLFFLAERKSVQMLVDSTLPYKAAVVLKSIA